ncbi:cytochrome b-c1 complex subunit 1, mitochondrial-like [Pectinophora gossypiella]|uniref:cytochrome b-c1 complex subunit 1, mitochondrial-like n=1 Tax=Pectinophora gossypiella TaxID=13191 RepID=UPI00214F102C|nr:cytochrome b-c1 complex subunit 1, mitochondrial-like [Pectinophora gossypiella]
MLRAAKFLQTGWQPRHTSVRCYAYPKKVFEMMKNAPPTCYTQLDNGLRVATERRDVAHACIGFFIDGGSRYESRFENGIAHFFEHIVFRGTRCRARSILEHQMSNTGARFHTFTTRELCGYYAECLCEDAPIIIDLLADCIFHNSLSRPEIEREKEIVFREIMQADEDANAVLFDYLHGAAYHGTTLAQSVMGQSSNLYNFCDTTIGRYLSKTFDPTRTVLAAVGGVKHEKIVELANHFVSGLQPSKCMYEDYRYTASDFRFRNDDLPFCNTAIAFEGPGLCDEDNYTMDVAAMYLGGWDRSQPGGPEHPNKIARAGLIENMCDAYRTFNFKYKDGGLWGIQFLGHPLYLDELLYNIQSEFMNLCCMVTVNEVRRAKRALKTRLMTKLENATCACIDLGRYTLYMGRRPELYERICEIDKVLPEDVHLVCSHYIYDRCPCVAAVGPSESLPEYNRIRAGQYWMRL